MKTKIKIRFQNGLSLQAFKKEVFDICNISDVYSFEETEDPDFIIFGPYGNDIPVPGKYTRIGYFCENIKPDLSVCEWAFGVPSEEEINDLHYKRIQWHGTNPELLVKPENYNPEEILKHKKHFCNFLYSNEVPYREEFFKQLSKYKRIDAPGKSMKNTGNIDNLYKGDIWERKRQFLNSYKFTIAFENYIYPGYQTEKLYDAMRANSIPIYCGDTNISQIFNSSAFINAADYMNTQGQFTNWLQKHSQIDFIDIRPQYYHTPIHRIKRKLKAIGRDWKMNLQLRNLDFGALIDSIIELDKDDNKYLQMLKQPWFNNNKPPLNISNKEQWIKIFNTGNVN